MKKENIFKGQKKESTVDFVINSFKKLLLEKKLLPGDSLPNETELAESFNVSRGSIREAMKILSAFGIVEIKRGDGTYISTSANRALLDPFLFSLILTDPKSRELVELRELIELQLMKLIIKNGDEEDLKNIEDIHIEMKKRIEEGIDLTTEELMEYELQFHAALGRATKNVLIEKIYSFILELFVPYIEKTYHGKTNGTNAISLHEDMINGLKERNIEETMEVTQKSIEEWRRLFNDDY